MKIALRVLCLIAAAYSLFAQSVDAVLARMDKAASAFQAASANIEMKTHTAIINDTTSENGTFKMQRLKSGEVLAVLDFSNEADARSIRFSGNTVRIYFPKSNMVQDYDLGRSSGGVLNQYLLLGFGSSGKDLARSYTVTSEGEEKVAGRDTTKLLLIPKDQKVQQKLSKIEMWVPNDEAYPIQQEFYDPSGNYRVVTYSHIVLNPKIKGKLDLKLPSGVKKRSS